MLRGLFERAVPFALIKRGKRQIVSLPRILFSISYLLYYANLLDERLGFTTDGDNGLDDIVIRRRERDTGLTENFVQ